MSSKKGYPPQHRQRHLFNTLLLGIRSYQAPKITDATKLNYMFTLATPQWASTLTNVGYTYIATLASRYELHTCF